MSAVSSPAAVDTITVAVTREPTMRLRLLYGAPADAAVTYTTDIKPSGLGAELIARHSIESTFAPHGNVALPMGTRLPMPGHLAQAARQRVLDAVAELRDEAPIERLGNQTERPAVSELWIGRRAPEPSGWIGQRFNNEDPRVGELLDALRREDMARSSYDFRGTDTVRRFETAIPSPH